MTRLRTRLTSLVLAAALPVALTVACNGDDGLTQQPGTTGNNPGVVDAGPTDAGPTDAGPDNTTGRACGTAGAGLAGLTGSTTSVRVVAANISTGNSFNYDGGEGVRILKGIKADVALMQEMRVGDNSDTAMRTFVTDTFGASFSYYREAYTQSGDIPNAIISRWPIVESGEWDDTRVSNRDFAWARIDIPGPRDMWAVSLHLLTADSATRNAEGVALVDFIRAKVPAGDYLTVGGDLNTDTRSEPVFATLEGTVCTAGTPPADQGSDADTNATRSKPYDHVLADGDLNHFQTATVIGTQSFANGLVVDTRVYTPIADLTPALATDSAASGMQHMAVVRDYKLPAQ